ncbi:MAG: hypothetical protein JWO58_712 [Chitinophagaceae bacterium]|nr:hypothetical protein [Chitinophagaceae bacterium]
MKYREQLSFIISFIALRILMIVLYTFFMPAQPGPYTPYIFFLYAVFDVLIIFFLYRYVKEIKQQRISLVAVLFIVLTIIFRLITHLYILPLTIEGLTPSEVMARQMLLTLLPFLIRCTMEFVIALQLLKNTVTGRVHFYLKLVGVNYLLLILIPLLVSLVNTFFPWYTLPSYILELCAALPLIAMILLYLQELKHFNEASDELDGPTVDGRL